MSKSTREKGNKSKRSAKEVTPLTDDRNVTDGGGTVCADALACLTWFLIFLTFPISIWCCIKSVNEYERAIIFRMGRLQGGPRDCKDSVTVTVDAVLYFQIMDAVMAVVNVADVYYSTKLLCQTLLRTTLGMKTLSEMLSDRESIARHLKLYLDKVTDPWGVKVDRVEIKDIRLPNELRRAMAAEAEATREARAKVIAAEGEYKAATSLKIAADNMAGSSCAIQLRYLQTLSSIAQEKKSTILFPLPMNIMLNAPM